MTNLHKHHRKLRAQGGDDSPANIMYITPEMHTWIHNNTGEAYERGWLVKSWQDPAEVPIQSWPEAFDHLEVGRVEFAPNVTSISLGRPLPSLVETLHPPKPGEECALCKRRVNHPKKPTSPESRVKSLRIPADDDTFDDDFARAMNIVGLTSEHKYVSHKFLRFVVDCIFRDEQEWAGAYLEGDA